MRALCSTVVGLVSTSVLLGAVAAPMDSNVGVGPGRVDIPASKVKKLSAAEVRDSKVLSQYIKSVEGQSNREVIYKVTGVGEITSDTLATLFPKWTFYVVPVAMAKNPTYKGPVAIAGGLYNVLGVDSRGESFEVSGSVTQGDVGKFLAANKVPLRNAKEGRLIWVAVCHLLRQGGADAEPRQAASDLWHLGLEVTGDFEYYYEVKTDEDGIILSGKLQANRIKGK